jgi:hypothetical protein
MFPLLCPSPWPRALCVSRESFRKHYLLTGLCHLTTPLDALLHGIDVGFV